MKDLLLKREAILDYSSKAEIALIQLQRVINSLRAWMTLLVLVPKSNKIYTCDALEIYYVIAAIYYEGTKTFFLEIYPELKSKCTDEDLQKEISVWKQEWEANHPEKIDKRYKILDLLRNEVAFHFKDRFIKKHHQEGKDKEDIKIGFTTDGKMGTTRFTNHMNYILTEIIRIEGNSIEITDYLSYLRDELLLSLVDKNCLILEKYLRNLYGDNLYYADDESSEYINLSTTNSEQIWIKKEI